jgi:hypothetical protein
MANDKCKIDGKKDEWLLVNIDDKRKLKTIVAHGNGEEAKGILLKVQNDTYKDAKLMTREEYNKIDYEEGILVKKPICARKGAETGHCKVWVQPKKIADGKGRVADLMRLGLNEEAARKYDKDMTVIESPSIKVWRMYRSVEKQRAVNGANRILKELAMVIPHTFGIELLACGDEEIALYINKGDTYDTTVLFNLDTGKFEVTSWGALIESYERQHHRCD